MRANWHTAVGEADRSDPFASLTTPVEEGSTRQRDAAGPSALPEQEVTDLDGFILECAHKEPGVEPWRRLRELVRAEAICAGRGLVCALKDRDWSHPTCVRCPERGSKGALCGIGVAQEAIVNG